MTDDDKERLRRLKAEVTCQLRHIDSAMLSTLAGVDVRLRLYVEKVAGAPLDHNLYEQLAVRRFLTMVRRYGINVTDVRRFMVLYENLHFPGTAGMTSYALTPVQVFQFTNIYGFWANGRRVVREALLFVPRKFSKTTSCAAVSVNDLLYGDANAESYIGANSADQAQKCFDVIRGCMRTLDPDGRRYTVNERIIKSRRRDRSAQAQCLTANARTKDGLSASTVIMDEFSQARDAQLLNVLTTSMGIRENPLTVIITTASDVFDGPFYEMLQGYKSILEGAYEDDSVFAHIFEPDVDDAEDDEHTWIKVQPHMGVTVSMEFYRNEWRRAQRSGAEGMLAFRTKLLNIFAEDERRSWISATTARGVARHLPLESIKGMPEAMVGIDLSERDDFSAVSFAIHDSRTSCFHFHTDYFFPEGALDGHPNEALYRRWAASGHLHLTRGPVIDYAAIVAHVMELSEHLSIVGIGYDGWKSLDLINMLAAAGGPATLKEVKQTYAYFTAPVQAFEHAMLTGHLTINDNPINFFCFGNAVLDTDKLENCKPVKRIPTRKIDGVITMLMALRLYIDRRQ